MKYTWLNFIYIAVLSLLIGTIAGVAVGKYYKEGLIEAELLICKDHELECICKTPEKDCWEYFEWEGILKELRDEDETRQVNFHVFDDPDNVHIELVTSRGNASYKWRFKTYEEFYEWYYNDYKLSH